MDTDFATDFAAKLHHALATEADAFMSTQLRASFAACADMQAKLTAKALETMHSIAVPLGAMEKWKMQVQPEPCGTHWIATAWLNGSCYQGRSNTISSAIVALETTLMANTKAQPVAPKTLGAALVARQADAVIGKCTDATLSKEVLESALYEALGSGNEIVQIVVRQLRNGIKRIRAQGGEHADLKILGLEETLDYLLGDSTPAT